MIGLAMFVALVSVAVVVVWRIVDMLRVDGHSWRAPEAFTWKAMPFKVASWRALSGESYTKTSSLPAATAAATLPMPAITGMDRHVGESLPDVFVDVGIWCD